MILIDKLKTTILDKKFRNWASFTLFIIIMIMGLCTYAYGKQTVEENIDLQWVSHTEYWNQDNASTIIRLADAKGNPIHTATCNVTILFPDKSSFIENAPLTRSSIEGNWYRTDDLDGLPLGTYEQLVTCSIDKKTIKRSQSFHVNPALAKINDIEKSSENITHMINNLDIQITSINDQEAHSLELLNSTLISLNEKIQDDQDLNENNWTIENAFINLSLDAKLEETEEHIYLYLSEYNKSITDLLKTSIIELENASEQRIENITKKIDSIGQEISMINAKSMDQENMTQLIEHFTTLESELASIANSSIYSEDIEILKEMITTLRAEQEAYISKIDNNLIGPYGELSIALVDKIDSILIKIGIIDDKTTEINDTTHQILDEIQGEISANIIS